MSYADEVNERRQREKRDRGVDLTQVAAIAHFSKSTFSYDSLDKAFPQAEPSLEPFGNDVLVQIRTPLTRTKG